VRIVVGVAAVDHVGRLAEHAIAVGESDRAQELTHVGELERLPLAQRRRAAPDVDDDVENRPARAPHELWLALVAGTAAGLEVHPPHDAAPGARVVVLDELVRDAELGPLLAAVGLHEEGPLVAEELVGEVAPVLAHVVGLAEMLEAIGGVDDHRILVRRLPVDRDHE